MLVDVQEDRMGNIHATPKNGRIAKKFARHLQGFGVQADGSAFFQEGGGAQEFLEDCSPSQRREISDGYRVSMRVDPWVFGQWLGWDACNVEV